jgi:protein-S-isoprenylcysteine O-methyltransferase Ste14
VNDSVLEILNELPWIVFLVYWLIAATKTRATQKREPAFSRYGVSLLLICGYLLIFNRRARVGFLRHRFLPDHPAVPLIGILLLWSGIGLAIWARRHLAENWSARVTIKVGHELIRTGPYARLRHPIYTGLLLATLGSAVMIGEWRGLFGVVLVLIAYSLKALKEESMLRTQFGSAFEEHRRQTGFLLPRF